MADDAIVGNKVFGSKRGISVTADDQELAELEAELQRIAKERRVTVEEVLVDLRVLVFNDPEPVEPPSHDEEEKPDG